jgi:DNA processing protein
MTARKLIAYTGSPDKVLNLKKKELMKIPGIGDKIITAISSTNFYKLADKELEFAEKYGIKITSLFDDDYPYRLKQCEDAPLIIFSKGKPIDNSKKYISIVGTRNATQYGKSFCDKFITELKNRGHDIVIVSGLAFGIDIAAHKAALKNNIPTYGVLAHGLDTIYPSQHRNIAAKMLQQGGLVTEFMHGMFSDKGNFVRRNRVIAGLCDATIVIESDIRGGALITAELANSYSRDVFAVPGRINDKYSSGTNKLIKINKASLIESVDDLEYIMNWKPQNKVIQKQLFVELTEDEKTIINLFDKSEELNIDIICKKSDFTMSKTSSILLNLEFQGVIKSLPGKLYCKIH